MNELKRESTTSTRLKEALAASGKKQIDLVRETGINSGAMSCYFTGKYEPKQITINKLAKALNVSEMWLCGYSVPMEREIQKMTEETLEEEAPSVKRAMDIQKILTVGIQKDSLCENMNELEHEAALAERIREAMSNAGKKQADLVRETGITKGTISRYLSGKIKPKTEHLIILAKVLGVSELWLWGYSVKMKEEYQMVTVQIKDDALFARKKAFIECVENLSEAELEKFEKILAIVQEK